MPQGHYGCIALLAEDLRIPSVTTRSAAERPQDTPGQHRDASGRLKDTTDGFMDLADTHGWGLWIFISIADVTLSIRIFY